MSWTRREFLLGTSSLVVAGLQRSVCGAQAPSGVSGAEFTPLRENVGTFLAQGGTIAWMVSPDGIVVVDAQMPPTAKICLEGLNARSGNRAIDCLFNTHHHFDHTSGNSVFRGGTRRIVAHVRVPELQTSAARPGTESDQVYADTLFNEKWTVRLGAETVTAVPYGPAHTAGDSIVVFERANIVHVGDLVLNRRLPVLDRPGGCRASRWISVLEKIAGDFAADTLYVFGHAKPGFAVVGSKQDLLFQRSFLSALLDHLRREIKAQKSREAIISAAPELNGFADHGPLSDRVIAPAYDELTQNS